MWRWIPPIAAGVLHGRCSGACFAAGELDFLTLEVRPSNAAALALYRELSFQPVGRRRDFYTDPTEDALLLTKTFKKEEPDG